MLVQISMGLLPSPPTILLILPPPAAAVGSGVETSLEAGLKESEAGEVGREAVLNTRDGGGGWGRPVAAGTGA